MHLCLQRAFTLAMLPISRLCADKWERAENRAASKVKDSQSASQWD